LVSKIPGESISGSLDSENVNVEPNVEVKKKVTKKVLEN